MNFTYSGRRGDGESVVVFADSYRNALSKANQERSRIDFPLRVEMVDPDTKTMLSFVGSVKKTSKEAGAEYDVIGGHRKGQNGLLSKSSNLAVSKVEQRRV